MSVKGIKLAEKSLKKSIQIFEQKVSSATPSSFLKPKGKIAKSLKPVSDTLGEGRTRLAAGKAMIKTMIDFFEGGYELKQRVFLVTLCWDEGVSLIKADFRPNLKAMKHKAYKAVKAIGLEAIGVLEIAPFRKSKLHKELLFTHCHLVAWTRDASFQPQKSAKALRRGAAFPNSLGFPSVTIRSRKKAAAAFKGSSEAFRQLFSNLDSDQTVASLAWLAQYLFKAPSYVQHAYKSKKGSERVKLRTSTRNYSHALARDVQKMLNTIPVCDAVFGVGEGRIVRQRWKQAFLVSRSRIHNGMNASAMRTSKKRRKKTRSGKRRGVQSQSSTMPRIHF